MNVFYVFVKSLLSSGETHSETPRLLFGLLLYHGTVEHQADDTEDPLAAA